jgi:formate hydrogenlyase transcriptional activator
VSLAISTATPELALSATTRINRKEIGLTWNAALETGGILVGRDNHHLGYSAHQGANFAIKHRFRNALDTKIWDSYDGVVVYDTAAILATPALAERYATLIRVSQTIRLHRDPKQLFEALANELQRAVPFEHIGVSLRDENSDTFCDHFIDMESGSATVHEKLPPEERLVSRVYEHQQPLLASTDEMDPRYERLRAVMKGLRIRSICALPLTTAHRKLGVISFGSKELDTYSAEEVRFLPLVADEIALAFDNALNFAALQQASGQLENDNKRLELLLELTNRLVSNRVLRDLLREICVSIRRVMQCEGAGITLPDPETGQLRVYAP